ncbi:small ubiquitin-related modifier 3-like [Myzus persicae]|uniref:small ubiquitin-related modifier 3-like n=1 Tax=Myzus persicae TaxID=13164 RepID=UPI000B937AA4|nr:small ubiquitin-related modifier 3-like [Myzus persicae]
MAVQQVIPEEITVQVLDQTNTMLEFRTKTNIRLIKIMVAYCVKTGLDIQTLRFRYDGYPIHQDDTPATMQMEDKSVIEVYQDQTGA